MLERKILGHTDFPSSYIGFSVSWEKEIVVLIQICFHFQNVSAGLYNIPTNTFRPTDVSILVKLFLYDKTPPLELNDHRPKVCDQKEYCQVHFCLWFFSRSLFYFVCSMVLQSRK